MRKVLLTMGILSASCSMAFEDYHLRFEPIEVEYRYSNFTIRDGIMENEDAMRRTLWGFNTDEVISALKTLKNASGSCTVEDKKEPICDVEYEVRSSGGVNIDGIGASGGGNHGNIEIIRLKAPCNRIPGLISELRMEKRSDK